MYMPCQVSPHHEVITVSCVGKAEKECRIGVGLVTLNNSGMLWGKGLGPGCLVLRLCIDLGQGRYRLGV
jgi:hypothetical protein